MVFLHVFFFFIIQLAVYKESKFKYSNNNELILDRIRRGKEAFDNVIKAKRKAEEEYKKKKNKKKSRDENEVENIYVKEIKCYEYVLEQLNSLNEYNCDEINENNKSLLALAKTKCIFARSTRDFPNESSGCVLDPQKLTKLQLYLYNNNLLKEFDTTNLFDYLTIEQLNKVEKITNPCINISHIDAYYFSKKKKVLLKKLDESNNNDNNNDNENKNNNNNNNNNNMSLTENYMTEDDIELNNKLCENLKYKIITNCTSKVHMTDVAFQIYHSELNHIDDICFYIQSTEWNKRTEANINRLSETSFYITKQLTTNLENMKLIENAQTKQIENTNKFDFFLRNLKNDFSDLMQILIKIKKHHDNLTRFVRGFKLVVSYLTILIFVLIVTSKSQTSNGRKKLLFCVILCYITEYLFRKFFYLLSQHILKINPIIFDYSIKGIRYGYLLIGVKILFSTILTYKEPIRNIEEQLIHIKRIVETNQNTLHNDTKEAQLNLRNPNDIFNDETAHILHQWSSYNTYLNSYYSDDSDYMISSKSSDGLSSSDVSLVSEDISLEKSDISSSSDIPVGKRIGTLYRQKRPIYFHYLPSPQNFIAFTETPEYFMQMVEYNHEKLMKLREERIDGTIKKKKQGINGKPNVQKRSVGENNKTIIFENEIQNETSDLYDLDSNSNSEMIENNRETLNKFYSINSQLGDE